MENLLQMFDLSWVQLMALIIAALLVGFAKTGIGGIVLIAIPILASAFGGKDSTGILLPMLLMGDVFAVWYYRKSVIWKNVFTPLPWAIIGLAIGAVVGNYISDKVFVILIGVIILFCLIILVIMERRDKELKVPNAVWFYILVGILCGFSSMIGNAAGPIFSVYLLALGFKKNNFMGTNAWFFFIINSLKVPLQIFVWHNIGWRSLSIAALMLPVLVAGAILGFIVLKKINDKWFRYIVIGMTALAALRLFI